MRSVLNHVSPLHRVKVRIRLLPLKFKKQATHNKHFALFVDTTVNLTIPSRDPSLRISSYTFPEKMYFFEGEYRRIWVRTCMMMIKN